MQDLRDVEVAGRGYSTKTPAPRTSAAWESCINIFDTADMYSDGASEEVLGRTLRDLAISRE